LEAAGEISLWVNGGVEFVAVGTEESKIAFLDLMRQIEMKTDDV